MPTTDRKVVPFSNANCGAFEHSTTKPPQTTRGAETFSKPSLPLLELCDGPTRATVLQRAIDQLHTLDAEQIQVVEIVIAAICRRTR